MPSKIHLIAVADLHFVSDRNYQCPGGHRQTSLGLEFLSRVLFRIRNNPPDALVLLGDFGDKPDLASATSDLQEIVSLVRQTKIPAVMVRGNHDLPEKDFLAIAEDLARPKIVSGFVLYPFHDLYRADETCLRPRETLNNLEKFCLENPTRPVVALQHNIVWPLLEVGYPMNLANSQEIADTYQKLPVCLSLSGHYHVGVPLQVYQGVFYLTAPAVCELPFSYLEVVLRADKSVEVKQPALSNNVSLPDVHCHTEFAYCGTTVRANLAIERARMFNCSRQVLTEHTTQLYVSPEEFSQTIFMKKPDLIRKCREEKRDRMENFLTTMKKLRSDFVLLGGEVELDYHQNITLLPEDQENFDLLLGAIHWLPEEALNQGNRLLEKSFLSACERLCHSGIQILAHPFRIFRRYKLPIPTHLYPKVADILIQTGVAAEINFHTNQPDPKFFLVCLEKGGKLALGTDAHCLEEAGDLSRHLDFLTNHLGLTEFDTAIFQPERKVYF
ncbi:MAG: metallophosphoesterase [Candidatus Omnitrophica bacterium]|nr:metallophosphoesterase [Candidatus Omnitrophota bacterium]